MKKINLDEMPCSTGNLQRVFLSPERAYIIVAERRRAVLESTTLERAAMLNEVFGGFADTSGQISEV